MHHLPLVTNIVVALIAALVGGLLARRANLPPIVGYLVAGVLLGPSTPGFVGDAETITQLAEIGIVLLMFGVGLHFSFGELWRVRGVAIPGALLQSLASTVAGYSLARAWGWSSSAALVLGIGISVASTIVLIRALMDRGVLDTRQGHIAVGWLVLEDIATVATLVLLPMAVGDEGSGGLEVTAWAIGKAALFLALMMIAGTRVVPWLLARIAQTRSRELFVLGALAVALGTALASAEFFGLSLALGAFVAGVVVRGSRYGHQISADLVPFRDAFSVLFFVSVGMLVDVGYVVDHLGQIAALAALVIAGKAVIAGVLTLALSRSATVALTVAAALAQVGEFTFIVGQAGVSLGILDTSQYSLLPAVALVSIVLNPAAFAAAAWLGRRLPKEAVVASEAVRELDGHVVVVGHGRVGEHVVEVLHGAAIPVLVIEQDERRLEPLDGQRVATLFGDAASSEILTHAALERARALVVAVADPISTELVVGRARELAPQLKIVARAQSHPDVEALLAAGASEVVDPQLEGAMELLRRALLLLEMPVPEVQRRVDALRSVGRSAVAGRRILDDLVRGTRDLELRWVRLADGNEAAGKTLGELGLRARTGVSCVAVSRVDGLVTNPDRAFVLLAGDELALIGAPSQHDEAAALLGSRGADRAAP